MIYGMSGCITLWRGLLAVIPVRGDEHIVGLSSDGFPDADLKGCMDAWMDYGCLLFASLSGSACLLLVHNAYGIRHQ
jgi:hypothetical protein